MKIQSSLKKGELLPSCHTDERIFSEPQCGIFVAVDVTKLYLSPSFQAQGCLLATGKNMEEALDATIIDLCLSVSPWAMVRQRLKFDQYGSLTKFALSCGYHL